MADDGNTVDALRCNPVIMGQHNFFKLALKFGAVNQAFEQLSGVMCRNPLSYSRRDAEALVDNLLCSVREAHLLLDELVRSGKFGARDANEG